MVKQKQIALEIFFRQTKQIFQQLASTKQQSYCEYTLVLPEPTNAYVSNLKFYFNCIYVLRTYYSFHGQQEQIRLVKSKCTKVNILR